MDERPCTVFARLNVKDPQNVAEYLYWLWDGEWPWEKVEGVGDLETLKEQIENDLSKNPWKAIEMTWGLQAPRKRMARLLWQLLQDAGEDEFLQRFTSQLHCLVKDAARCAEILPPIQERLRWVFDGLEIVGEETVTIGQAGWGETWYLPPEQARFVREQLQKVHPDLLQKKSDYQDAVRAFLNYLVTKVYQYFDPPSKDPDRIYVGEIVVNGTLSGVRNFVWIRGTDGQHPLPNVRAPYTYPVGIFGWGYWGSGSSDLALSILADATGGNLELARQLKGPFLGEVVTHFPREKPMCISRREVLLWLETYGITEKDIIERQAQIQKQKTKWEPVIRHRTAILEKELYAQRFDLVPADFESALYVDFMELLQSGGRVFRCSRCGLPISYDGSPRSNRQRARWLRGEPIYHPGCFKEVVRERKRSSWQQWAQNPAVREKRRQQARERRRQD